MGGSVEVGIAFFGGTERSLRQRVLRYWQGCEAVIWFPACDRWRGRMVCGFRVVRLRGRPWHVVACFSQVVEEYGVCDVGEFCRAVARRIVAGDTVEGACVDVLRRAVAVSLRAQLLA